MKKYLLVLALIVAVFSANTQEITFEDGTTVNVNHASFDYQSMRRASVGIIINVDGLAGSKLATASYLQPEKFHVAANIGFASVSVEGTIFIKGQTKQREKGFAVKYAPGGFNTIKKYILKHPVEKRKEIGLYLAANDYGHILKEQTDASRVDHYPYLKQMQVFAGVSFVNYWHSNINVDDNHLKRGQYTGRIVFAPFITVGAEADTLNYTVDDAPKYGARLMYELSNTFGLMGAKIRGRTNLIIRMGADAGFSKKKNTYIKGIFGIGIVYNFAEGAH